MKPFYVESKLDSRYLESKPYRACLFQVETICSLRISNQIHSLYISNQNCRQPVYFEPELYTAYIFRFKTMRSLYILNHNYKRALYISNQNYTQIQKPYILNRSYT